LGVCDVEVEVVGGLGLGCVISGRRSVATLGSV
jgi:hypothetical protein